MLDPFIIRALSAGIIVALIAGTMGSFVVWRKMAYFGDSLSHSALLGIAMGLATGISINLSTILTCSLFAITLVWLQHKKILATDTLLGILAHASLSVGMVAISLLGKKIDIHAYLFGDILTVTTTELYWIIGGGTLVLCLLFCYWSSLVLMSIHEDLALAENINTFITQLVLMFTITIIVAVSIRIVGILLITSMLIIPAATSRQLARSPETMALFGAVFGIIAVIIGMLCSLQFDTPSGPTIVATSATIFALTFPLATFFRSQKKRN